MSCRPPPPCARNLRASEAGALWQRAGSQRQCSRMLTPIKRRRKLVVRALVPASGSGRCARPGWWGSASAGTSGSGAQGHRQRLLLVNRGSLLDDPIADTFDSLCCSFGDETAVTPRGRAARPSSARRGRAGWGGGPACRLQGKKKEAFEPVVPVMLWGCVWVPWIRHMCHEGVHDAPRTRSRHLGSEARLASPPPPPPPRSQTTPADWLGLSHPQDGAELGC